MYIGGWKKKIKWEEEEEEEEEEKKNISSINGFVYGSIPDYKGLIIIMGGKIFRS